jgi:hypothetical protein
MVPPGYTQASHAEGDRTTLSLGPVDEDRPMLALAGVETLADARLVARDAAARTGNTYAVVELPEDAPTRYALATMLVNGEVGYDIEDVRAKHGRLHPSVKLLVDAEVDLELDQATNEVSDATQPAGTVPVSGRTIEAMATDIVERYDTGRDGMWIGDSQRTDDEGHTFSVAPLLIHGLEAKVDADPTKMATYEDTSKLAAAIRSVAAHDGDARVLDGMEMTSWNATYGAGERDITWGWKDLFESVTAGTKSADGDVELTSFDDNVDLLALPTVSTTDEALRWARQVAAANGSTIAVVRAPYGAPATYALARLTSQPDDDLAKGKGLDPRIVGMASADKAVTVQR